MTLLERLLRAIVSTGTALREVRIEVRGTSPQMELPAELRDALPLRWSRGDAPLGERLQRALSDCAGDPLIALAADCVTDTRVIAHLCETQRSLVFLDGHDPGGGAALRLEGDVAPVPRDLGDLGAIALHVLSSGTAKPFAEDDFDSYLPMLRRDLPPYVRRVGDAASRDRVERFLFWSNYKGSTDFLTRYVYPPFVWAMVQPLARWRVHPNWVTAVDWLAAFAAVPYFVTGAWLPGLALGYLMSILDSVDGKLARLTYTSSRFGELLDHGLDIVHPPVWYLAWGYSLGGGDLHSGPFQASLWLLAAYVLDRLCTLAFKKRTGRSIHGITPLDEKVRTFISRRNVNLALLTVALGVDWAHPGWHAAQGTFYLIATWQVACVAWHAERLVRFWSARAAR